MVVVAEAEGVSLGVFALVGGAAFPVHPAHTANATIIVITIMKFIHVFFILI
jgi:hypothetical protein